jgi:hypothetical protein
MTYEQALALLRNRYGTQPWTQASGTEVQSYLRSMGVPSTYITQIGTAYYTAQRTGTTIDSVLQSKGYLTPTTTATAPAPTTTTATATTPTTTVPVISVPSFTTPTATTTTAPVVTVPTSPATVAPSALASQESGAIGAASIASQLSPLPTVTPPPPTIQATSMSAQPPSGAPTTIVSDGIPLTWQYSPTYGKYLYVGTNSAGQMQVLHDTDLAELLNSGYGFSGNTLQRTTTAPSTTTTTTPATTLPPVSTVSPVQVPTVTNPLAAATPVGSIPTITVPTLSATAPTAVKPAIGGSPEDIAAYREAIRRLTANQLYAKTEGAFQQADIRARAESQIQKAGREMYNARRRAIASLGARGIAGAPGLSVAATRAGGAAAEYQRSQLQSERDRQIAALNRALTKQLTDYEEEIRQQNEKLTKATTLANQLTGATQ